MSREVLVGGARRRLGGALASVGRPAACSGPTLTFWADSGGAAQLESVRLDRPLSVQSPRSHCLGRPSQMTIIETESVS